MGKFQTQDTAFCIHARPQKTLSESLTWDLKMKQKKKKTSSIMSCFAYGSNTGETLIHLAIMHLVQIII